ncbi:uncharacterized protein LOC122956372 isoform X2 [Acropora millepora]|uniref:uncharacterized protein LOC122956372 isoform X2 n=1 Tax=Acropora millepora TaxID=45264 RepID=UPI001CF260BA|nr:uncharacterized protein LOC122956372 isoform X2 [Acropora millepora]
MQESELFKKICTILEGSNLDMRSQLNYALLLFSTGKILEKLGLDEYFTLVETYFVNAILPSVHGLLNDGESSKSHEPQTYSAEEEQQFNSLIEKIVVQCTASPHQTRRFFIPKATMKTKCKCGDVFGFKVSEAMKFIGCQEREQALKTFVTTLKRGCVGRLTFPTVGQYAGCLHVQRLLLPEELLRKMDEAFHRITSGPTTSAKTRMENAGTDPNISNAMQSQQGPEIPVICDQDDSEEEKERLDEEILAKEAERAEVEEQEKGNQARKIGKKGRKRNEVCGLQDTLHPGNVLEKRTRISKK